MDKKALKKQYAETPQPMGVFQVRNLLTGRIFIDSGPNVNGKINSCRFQLQHGSHMNRALQEDFNKSGADNFAFEVLDMLKPREDKKADYTEDLNLLEEMWIEKFQPFGEKGYHIRKLKK